jgi:hypothetical protein
MRPTQNWSPALTDRATDFFLGPPALCLAALFFLFDQDPMPETSIGRNGASKGPLAKGKKCREIW